MALEKDHWEGHPEVGTLALRPPVRVLLGDGNTGHQGTRGTHSWRLVGKLVRMKSRACPASIGQVPEDLAFQTDSQQPGRGLPVFNLRRRGGSR